MTTDLGDASAAGRRAELLAGATAWAFENGLAGLSLRPLARALGTSDRMLVYYFGSKDELVAAIAAQAADALGDALPTVDPDRPPASAAAWLDAAWSLLGDPAVRPALALLFELDAMGVRAPGAARSASRMVSEHALEGVDEALAALGVPAARREAGFSALVSGAVVGIVLDELVSGAARSRAAIEELARLIDDARA
jgi:AcrR family transcriptional regulator